MPCTEDMQMPRNANMHVGGDPNPSPKPIAKPNPSPNPSPNPNPNPNLTLGNSHIIITVVV